MTSVKKKRIFTWIWVAVFVLAAALRLVRLGHIPLNNMEADIALQAQAIAEGREGHIGPETAVIGLTGFSFFIFEAGNFLARFWAALFGSLIVFVPLIFKKFIGGKAAILSAFFFAIAPEMVGLSRILGSPMNVVVFLVLAAGFFALRKPILLGLSVAMGLMSGPGFWIGLLILGLSFLISELLFSFSDSIRSSSLPHKRQFWIRFGLSFLLTVAIVGTSFFRAPQVLSGVFSGLVAFIKGFDAPGITPWFLMPLTFLAYSLSAVAFGLWGSLRALILRERIDLFLFVWWVLGLVFIFLYPASQPADMVWVALPLWLLTARVIVDTFKMPETQRIYVFTAAIMVIIISAFILLALRSLVRQDITQTDQIGLLVTMIGGAVLLAALILLISYGASESIAVTGLVFGLLIVTTAGLISLSVNATGLGSEIETALWYPDEPQLTTRWMEITIDQVMDWNTMESPPIEIVVTTISEPGMAWALRDYGSVWFMPFLSPQSQPGILITDAQGIPEISNSYRGQDLVWSRRALWAQMSPFQYLNWLITRDVPTQDQQIILWVRTDLMPDAQFSP
jgi:hypothetical protein